MAVPNADPRAKELDSAFEQAMSAPAKPRVEAKAPPATDPEAPLGRNDDGTPKAPYGFNKDGSVRRAAGGRRAKDDPNRPRTAPPGSPQAQAASALKGQGVTPVDYTEGLVGAADGIWLVMTAATKLPLGRLRIGNIGLPQDMSVKLGAQAHIFDKSKGQLVVALNEAAKHNARAQALAAKLATGDASWVLTVASLAGPFVAASIALWKGDGQLDVAAMNAANDAEMERVMEALNEQARKVQEQAMAAQVADAAKEREFYEQHANLNGESPDAYRPGPMSAMPG